LTAARQGDSAVIVVRGEAGAGKSTLLDEAVARARGLMVLRTRGADQDAEQRFVWLADLCEPLLDRLEHLPGERAAALASAVHPGAAARVLDRYAVYAGLLDLLTSAAEETPIVVVVDDAHLLDAASAEALPVVARRLRIDGIALIIATESDDGLCEAEELRLGPLDSAYARALLSIRFGAELAPSVVESLVESGQGNPLALLEIARDLTPEQRRAEAPLDASLPPSAEWAYLRRRGAASRHAPGAAHAPSCFSDRGWPGQGAPPRQAIASRRLCGSSKRSAPRPGPGARARAWWPREPRRRMPGSTGWSG
jgi:AAA ATPase domain